MEFMACSTSLGWLGTIEHQGDISGTPVYRILFDHNTSVLEQQSSPKQTGGQPEIKEWQPFWGQSPVPVGWDPHEDHVCSLVGGSVSESPTGPAKGDGNSQ